MGHLDGKVAVVTGAGAGMGRATAITYAREGAKVLAWDLGVALDGKSLDKNPVDEVVEEIQAEGGEAIAFHGDVASMEDAEKAIGTAVDTWGKLDILTCIAGILRERMVFNMTEDEWDDVIRVHLKGTFAPTKFAAIHWRQRREFGRLTAFSSGAFEGGAGQPNYSAAKGGIIGFVRSTALAMARYEVTANAICPSAATRMTDNTLQSQELIRKGSPVPSTVAGGTDRDPFNVPPLLVWLSSDAGRIASGRVWRAEGWHYGLYDEPREVRFLHSDGPWDMDMVFDKFHEALSYDMTTPIGRTADDIRQGN